MANVFSRNEVVELGVQIEKNGMAFYNTLVKKSKDKKAIEIFKFLAGEEEKHIAAFKKILDSVRRYEPQEAYPGEYFAYMNALASEHVFTKENKGEKMASNTKTDREAVGLGIGFEKESILFYEGMKKVVHPDEGKVIDALIEQEEDHLRKLIDLKKGL